jgi:hypothetical protein
MRGLQCKHEENTWPVSKFLEFSFEFKFHFVYFLGLEVRDKR